MIKNLGLAEIATWCKQGTNIALCIAPHPDDSAFIAGTLYLLRQRYNVIVKVCLVTLGKGGFATNPQIATKRQQEFREECKISGAETIYLENYLHRVYPEMTPDEASLIDGQLENNKWMRDALTRLLRDEKPSVLFVPSNNEKHYDHRATRDCIKAAIWRAGRPSKLGNESGKLGRHECHHPSQIKVYEYETVTMSLGQEGLTYVDITDVWDVKLAAFGAHKTQIVRDPISYIVAVKAISEQRGRELYPARETSEVIMGKIEKKLQKFLNSKLKVEELEKLSSNQFIKEIITITSVQNPKAEAFKCL